MDPVNALTQTVLKLNNGRSKLRPHIQLSMPATISIIPSDGNKLETLIERFLTHALAISHPSRHVRVGVYQKRKMADLEKFFCISPLCWVHFRVESHAATGLENGAKKILKGLGYFCSEWVGVEDSEAQLGAFRFGTQESVTLILFIRNRRARRICDILIPVNESVPFLAHAI
jgi:hypothetical protein